MAHGTPQGTGRRVRLAAAVLMWLLVDAEPAAWFHLPPVTGGVL